jgi:hypothetical protein
MCFSRVLERHVGPLPLKLGRLNSFTPARAPQTSVADLLHQCCEIRGGPVPDETTLVICERQQPQNRCAGDYRYIVLLQVGIVDAADCLHRWKYDFSLPWPALRASCFTAASRRAKEPGHEQGVAFIAL